MISLPQHLLNACSEQPFSLARRQVILAAAVGIASLVVPSDALSVASPPRLYQPRLVSDQKHETLQSRRNALLSSIAPSLDNEAWLVALFEDEAGSVRTSYDQSLSDRILETSVKDAVKPGSLVSSLQQSKGADIGVQTVDHAEALMQQQAQMKRRQAAAPLVTASSKHRAGKTHPLTKEYEYTLANAIQAGVHVHKLKADYESQHDKPLSKKEWAALAKLDTTQLRHVVAEYRSAKQELVSSNMGLVHAISRDFIRRPQFKELTLDELIQEGSLGLIRAAELFDPNKGLRFSTYATIWIQGALRNTRIGEFVVLPTMEKKAWKEIRGVVRDLEKSGSTHQKEITTKLIAEKLGMKPEKVDANIKRMTSVSNVLSLDYQYASTSRGGDSNGQEKRNEKFLMDDVDLAEQARLKADIVVGLVSNLNEKEIHLLRLIYGLNNGKEHTIKDSAEILGMNKETARLLHKSCLKKLKEAKNMESLHEYLMTVA